MERLEDRPTAELVELVREFLSDAHVLVDEPGAKGRGTHDWRCPPSEAREAMTVANVPPWEAAERYLLELLETPDSPDTSSLNGRQVPLELRQRIVEQAR